MDGRKKMQPGAFMGVVFERKTFHGVGLFYTMVERYGSEPAYSLN